MTRISTKIGDIFSVKIGDKKKYFQYIANDLTQLNSDVVRGFKMQYSVDSKPNLSDVIKSDVDFYAHCVIKLGVKMGLWEKVGNDEEVGDTKDILFRSASDYARKAGEEPIKVSSNWYVWKINDKDFSYIGKLDGE